MAMSDLREKVIGLKQYMQSRIIGQEDLVQKMLITIWAGMILMKR